MLMLMLMLVLMLMLNPVLMQSRDAAPGPAPDDDFDAFDIGAEQARAIVAAQKPEPWVEPEGTKEYSTTVRG
eukprot:gene6567-5108_t